MKEYYRPVRFYLISLILISILTLIIQLLLLLPKNAPSFLFWAGIVFALIIKLCNPIIVIFSIYIIYLVVHKRYDKRLIILPVINILSFSVRLASIFVAYFKFMLPFDSDKLAFFSNQISQIANVSNLIISLYLLLVVKRIIFKKY
jgi:hypothetical protein